MSTKLFNKRSQKTGMPPGTLIHIGEKSLERTKITLIDYDANNLEEKVIKSIDEIFPFKDKASVTWINIDGIEQIDVLEEIDKSFGIHPLVLEDILNTSQRPKMEDHGDYIFIVLRMFQLEGKSRDIKSEQVSIILGPNYVISFQETPDGDVFDPIRDRIRNSKGRIRKMDADFLAYALMDAIVDNYFVVLENLGAKIEKSEEDVVLDIKSDVHLEAHALKRQMIYLRKHIWPLRDLIISLQRGESKLIKKTTTLYLRDVYDHAIQVMDTIDSFRDILGGIQDVYLSNIGHKTNEIMKVMTIFSAVFIPLNFIASVYGMNFENMPELKWFHGYYLVLGVMSSAALGMLFYFKRNKWL